MTTMTNGNHHSIATPTPEMTKKGMRGDLRRCFESLVWYFLYYYYTILMIIYRYITYTTNDDDDDKWQPSSQLANTNARDDEGRVAGDNDITSATSQVATCRGDKNGSTRYEKIFKQ